jgi:hypothetical protein
MDDAENISLVITGSLIAGETMCPQSCSLAMAVVLLSVTQLLLGSGSACYSELRHGPGNMGTE